MNSMVCTLDAARVDERTLTWAGETFSLLAIGANFRRVFSLRAATLWVILWVTAVCSRIGRPHIDRQR